MNSLNTEWLAIKKSRAKSAVINPSAVYNLRHELERICEAFSDVSQAKGIQLSLSCPNDIPVVFWDFASLQTHVFNNILSNQINYMQAGGVIEISLIKSGEYIMIVNISHSGKSVFPAVKSDLLRKSKKAGKDNNCKPGLKDALLCIQAHKGTLSFVDAPEFSTSVFKIEIPLYSLCLQ